MPVPSWKTEFRKVAPNVWTYIQGGGPGQTTFQRSNATAIIGDDAVMIVDTLQGPIPIETFIADLRKVTDKPVRHVVNTHGHPDHTSGNQYFRDAEIIAHQNAVRLMSAVGIPGGKPVWDKTPDVARGGEPHELVMPTTRIPNGRMRCYYGALEIELHAVDYAHSDGDIAVWLPQEKILVAGDLAFFYVPPSLLSGTSEGFLKQVEWMEALGAETIIPGHGPVGGMKEVRMQDAYVRFMRAAIKKGYDAGLSPIDAAVQVDLGEYGDWPDAEDRLIRNGLRIYAEYAGTPRKPINFQDALTAGKEFDAKRRARGIGGEKK